MDVRIVVDLDDGGTTGREDVGGTTGREDVGGITGREEVGLGGWDGRGGLEGRGGLVPPFVGVSAWLPSQYIVRPSSVKSLSIVLIPSVPAPLQYTPFV